MSPDYTDHMCIIKIMKRFMENIGTGKSRDVSSDHHLLVAKLKMRWAVW